MRYAVAPPTLSDSDCAEFAAHGMTHPLRAAHFDNPNAERVGTETYVGEAAIELVCRAGLSERELSATLVKEALDAIAEAAALAEAEAEAAMNAK